MSNQKFSKSLLGLKVMVRVGVRIISWYIWCNFEKFINYRPRNPYTTVQHRDTSFLLTPASKSLYGSLSIEGYSMLILVC